MVHSVAHLAGLRRLLRAVSRFEAKECVGWSYLLLILCPKACRSLHAAVCALVIYLHDFDLASGFSGLFSQIVYFLAGFAPGPFTHVSMGLAGGLGQVITSGGTRPSCSERGDPVNFDN